MKSKAAVGSTGLYAKECKEIVYHTDQHAMFMDLSSLHSKPPSGPTAKKLATTVEYAVSAEALNTFRANCSTEDYYSLPGAALSFQGGSGGSAGCGANQMTLQYHDESDFDQSEDEHDGNVHQALTQSNVFLKVVNKKPIGMKIDKSDDPTKGRHDYSDIIVTLHRLREIDEEKKLSRSSRNLFTGRDGQMQ